MTNIQTTQKLYKIEKTLETIAQRHNALVEYTDVVSWQGSQSLLLIERLEEVNAIQAQSIEQQASQIKELTNLVQKLQQKGVSA